MLHPPRTLRFWHRNKPAKKFPALHGQKNPHLPQGRPEVSLLRCKSRHHPTAEEQSFHIPGAPNVIIANTVKGKGISFMENNILWHYRFPHDGWEYDNAIKELHETMPAGITDPYDVK